MYRKEGSSRDASAAALCANVYDTGHLAAGAASLESRKCRFCLSYKRMKKAMQHGFGREVIMKRQNCYRDFTIGEIGEEHIGRTLRAAGWIENIRDHGGVSFLDLRDMYGVLQVVIRRGELLEGLSRESCITVQGVVEKRSEDTYNPRLSTGTIELEAREIQVLGRVCRPLPFEVMTSRETREEVRLKYRYLDLRNSRVRDNILFRARLLGFLRQKMTELGFVEIQTPILSSSSPEGARDYLVPSRKY